MPVTFFDQFGQYVEKQFANFDSNNLYVIISFSNVGRYEGIVCSAVSVLDSTVYNIVIKHPSIFRYAAFVQLPGNESVC